MCTHALVEPFDYNSHSKDSNENINFEATDPACSFFFPFQTKNYKVIISTNET